MKTRLALAVFVAVGSCKLSSKENGHTSEALAVVDSRLPVRGTFGLVSFDSWNEKAGGGRVSVSQKFDPRSESNRSTFDLDASGDGTISGMGSCNLQSPSGMKRSSALVGSASWDGMRGAVGAVYLLAALAEMMECVTHQPGTLTKKSISVRTEHDLMGREVRTLSKNLGFVGGKGQDATSECKTMLGTRHVIIHEKASACIGFEDSTAEKLKIIMVKHGEIYANRVKLIRLP